jgi:hypothetical protein
MAERRRLLDRQKRFASRWKVDTHGAYVQYANILVRIVPEGKEFMLCMNGRLGKQIFRSALDAKIKAFEVLDSGAAVRYLRNLQQVAHVSEATRWVERLIRQQ